MYIVTDLHEIRSLFTNFRSISYTDRFGYNFYFHENRSLKNNFENRSKKGLNQKNVRNILKSGLFGICIKKLVEIGHVSREQIEFEYDTWKL